MVTSTSTPASMLMMICLTTSVGACRLHQVKRELAASSPEEKRGIGNSLNQTLVNAHLILVPGLGTLTAGRLPGHDAQRLGGQADGALDVERLGACALNQLLADLLERGDLARGEGDTDLVDFLAIEVSLSSVEGRKASFD